MTDKADTLRERLNYIREIKQHAREVIAVFDRDNGEKQEGLGEQVIESLCRLKVDILEERAQYEERIKRLLEENQEMRNQLVLGDLARV